MGHNLADINASLAHATGGKMGIANTVHRVDVAKSMTTHLFPLCGDAKAQSFVYGGSNIPVSCAKCLKIEKGKKSKQKRTGREGRSLETLILNSQSIVRLTKIPLSAKRLPGGKVIAMAGPIDFVGGYMDTKELFCFDAKQSKNPNRLETGKTHLHPHQRAMIVRYGDAGFLAGLLCECSTDNRLHWCQWQLLVTPRPSIPWSEMLPIGISSMPVDWQAIRRLSYADKWKQDVVRADPEGFVKL